MSANLKLALLKFGVYAAALAIPLAAGFLDSWTTAGAVGPFVALLLRQFDKTVIEPYEAVLDAEAAADTDTDSGAGDPGSETAPTGA